MSAVCILAPVVIGNWSVITAAVTGAVTAMGFCSVKDQVKTLNEVHKHCHKAEIKVENSEAVTEALNLDQTVLFTKNDLTVEFSRDARGRCGVKVYSPSRSEQELLRVGQEVAQRVVQQYVYNRLMTELSAKNYHIAAEEVGEDNTIKLKVRKWEA